MTPPLCGFPVQVSKWLAGSKRAVLADECLYVSPAMFSLMESAEGPELEHLLRNLPVLKLETMIDQKIREAVPKLLEAIPAKLGHWVKTGV